MTIVVLFVWMSEVKLYSYIVVWSYLVLLWEMTHDYPLIRSLSLL